MRKLETKESAVDLTDLAIGLIVLGIAVTIGVTILIGIRDSRLTELPTFNVVNETVSIPAAATELSKVWFKQVVVVTNNSGGTSGDLVLSSGNYTTSVSSNTGRATFTNSTPNGDYDTSWLVTYNCYNTSRADFKLPNDAAVGLGEYGNWFKIIVIVGVAAVVLSIIFLAFGGRKMGGSGGIGGEY